MEKGPNFLEEIVAADVANKKHDGRVLTRFPPEPNGYLHIGHSKSICLNFGLAKQFGGKTNLRFDDTNPVTEDTEYVESIKEDIRWLGFEWANEFYASDYFEQLYEFAVTLIKKGLAYVDDLSAEEIAALYVNQSTRYLVKNYTGLADGNHSFKANTQDRAGNVNSTETLKILKDQDKLKELWML